MEVLGNISTSIVLKREETSRMLMLIGTDIQDQVFKKNELATFGDHIIELKSCYGFRRISKA